MERMTEQDLALIVAEFDAEHTTDAEYNAAMGNPEDNGHRMPPGC